MSEARNAGESPIYLDHHATTPCAPEVVAAMMPWLSGRCGNASSIKHGAGKAAAVAVESARVQLAQLVSCSPKALTFTSGATESINLALRGVFHAYRDRGNHIVVGATEHRAVLDTAEALAAGGADVSLAPVDPGGKLKLDALSELITDNTVLVCVMAANNEVGTIQELAPVVELAHAHDAFVLADAVQAAGKVPLDLVGSGVDLAALSAHKMYGPQGVGALYVRQRPFVRLTPQLVGGGQERGLRAGTLNVAGIVGFGAAAALCRNEMADVAARVAALRDQLETELCAVFPHARVHGDRSARLPHNLSIAIDGLDAGALLAAVGHRVAISSGSACSTTSDKPSHVLEAMGLDRALAYATLRFGLGRDTTPSDVERALEILKPAIAAHRTLGSPT